MCARTARGLGSMRGGSVPMACSSEDTLLMSKIVDGAHCGPAV